MQTFGHLSARQWVQLSSVALLLAVTIVIGVAVVLPTMALVLGLALLVASLLAVVQSTWRVARKATRAVGGTHEAADSFGPTLHLDLPDGRVVAARQIHLSHESEHILLLTRHGYVIIDATGRPIHILSPAKTV